MNELQTAILRARFCRDPYAHRNAIIKLSRDYIAQQEAKLIEQHHGEQFTVIPEIYPRVENIARAACAYYNVAIDDIKSYGRKRKVAFCRQVVMYLAKKLTPLTLKTIGEFFDNERDHATLLHGIHKIEAMVAADATVAAQVEEIKAAILAAMDGGNQ